MVVLNNSGSDPLTSAGINYFFDQDPAAVFSWTGSLGPDEALELTLPALITVDGAHTFTCYTSSPNGGPDGYNFNDTVTSDFIVNTEPALEAPFLESFDGEDFPPDGWSQGSHIMHDWGETSLASYSGTGSAVRSNYWDGWVGMHYDLDMPLLDISGGTNAELAFRYAYAWYPGNNLDSMQVFISSDCGGSWDTLFNKGGWKLATSPNTYDLFFPKVPGDWKEESFSLTEYTGEVLIRFRSVCGYGNNLYLDDVMVSLAVGDEDIPQAPAFSIFPNPVESELHVTGLQTNTEIYVTDITGKLLMRAKIEDDTSVIDLSWLPEGIYILRTPSGSRKIVKI